MVAKDVVEKNRQDINMICGTLRITAAENENILLLPQDIPLDTPAGCNTFLGEKAPGNAATYARKAERSGA